MEHSKAISTRDTHKEKYHYIVMPMIMVVAVAIMVVILCTGEQRSMSNFMMVNV